MHPEMQETWVDPCQELRSHTAGQLRPHALATEPACPTEAPILTKDPAGLQPRLDRQINENKLKAISLSYKEGVVINISKTLSSHRH